MSSFSVSTDETHSSKQAMKIPNFLIQVKHIVQNRPYFSHSKQNEQNESYLTQWHTRGFQNVKLVSKYSKSVSSENSKSFSVNTGETHSSKQAIFFSFQTE